MDTTMYFCKCRNKLSSYIHLEFVFRLGISKTEAHDETRSFTFYEVEDARVLELCSP